MTWINEDELILVDRIRDDIEEEIQPKKYYRVQVGLSVIERMQRTS